jgi:hypothetical protein
VAEQANRLPDPLPVPHTGAQAGRDYDWREGKDAATTPADGPLPPPSPRPFTAMETEKALAENPRLNDALAALDKTVSQALAEVRIATRSRMALFCMLSGLTSNMNQAVAGLGELEPEDLHHRILDLSGLYRACAAIIDRVRDLHGKPALKLEHPTDSVMVMRTPNRDPTQLPEGVVSASADNPLPREYFR